VQSRINEQTPRHEPPATLQRVFPTAKALHFSPAKRHDFSPPFTTETLAFVVSEVYSQNVLTSFFSRLSAQSFSSATTTPERWSTCLPSCLPTNRRAMTPN
jgi:hypothetical protein